MEGVRSTNWLLRARAVCGIVSRAVGVEWEKQNMQETSTEL